ncbi:hypothetical protein [Larsenimonas rhizosphaerae]|uniref:HTH araC/xylS-type domain-containing protein n=1 Tax=Larsenimonas rhizosphaerae TaxID=2944682 RepID=A0AA41ZGK1_9GAMM|nr:hypothetical protein [Larsenimonas rhizosphaerae]MCX2524140.1 hypothetical protein [Larsenimonas rhizosphaerae]
MGTSQGHLVTLSRLERARQQILSDYHSMAQVTAYCRPSSAEQLRRPFQCHPGLSPSLYHARSGSLEAS